VKDNTALLLAGAFAMGMKIFQDLTSVLSSVAEQVASYIGCIIGSLLANLGGGFDVGGGGQQSVQNFTPTGAGCFAAETRVLMPDGRLKMISEIRVGDVVKTGAASTDVAHVAEVLERDSTKARDLQFSWVNGDRTDSVRTTDEHLFWVDGQGWVEARSLRPGDWLRDEYGRPVRVTENHRIAEALHVYTFRLREDTAFYANGVLVHDMCGFWNPETVAAQSGDGPPKPQPLGKEGR
jgi:hypothetical protein